MEEKRAKTAKLFSDTGALTIDEIRTLMGKEALDSGGDIVYQPMNLVPVGTDGFTDDNRQKPARSKADDIAMQKAYFRKMLMDQGYDKEYIDKCLKEQYE